MALLRKLILGFLFSVLCMSVALLWFMEKRHPSQDYSEVIDRLNNNQIVKLEFTGNKLEFTDRDQHTFVTTVPDVSKFLERIQGENIRVIVKEDRSNLIYMTIISVFVIVLILVVWWSLMPRKIEESKFANDKLLSLGGDELYPTPQYQSEDEKILHALRQANGNKAKAAKILGVARSTLYRQMRRNNIKD